MQEIASVRLRDQPPITRPAVMPVGDEAKAVLQKAPELYQLHYMEVKDSSGTSAMQLINEVAHQWEKMALNLHFKEYMIQTISRNHPKDCEAACLDMFTKWLLGNPDTRQPITWQTLIESIGETNSQLARELMDAVLCIQ